MIICHLYYLHCLSTIFLHYISQSYKGLNISRTCYPSLSNENLVFFKLFVLIYNDWRDGLARIELCVSEIREWMNQNMLKLNDDKTELIVFASKYKPDLYNDLSITIGDTVVDCSSQVKDLGVIFDRVLSLRQHVSYTSKTCLFHLRNISRIRKYIPQDINIVLIKSLVMSRLDYSNGLLYGLPKCTVSGLQAVQNSAARIVTQERLRDHDSMSRALMELHWLLVEKRIEYKLLPRRVLRSAESNLLTVPPGKPGKYGSRSFVRASANLWNSLRGERAAWLKNSQTVAVCANGMTDLLDKCPAKETFLPDISRFYWTLSQSFSVDKQLIHARCKIIQKI